MKLLKKIALTAAAVSLFNLPAYAASSASAALDWANSSLSFIVGSGSWALNDSSANAYTTNGVLSSGNANGAALATANASQSDALGAASAQSFASGASIGSNVTATGGNANAWAGGNLGFSVTLLSGTVARIVVPYTIALSTTGLYGNEAHGEFGLYSTLLTDGTEKLSFNKAFTIGAQQTQSSSDSISYLLSNFGSGSKTYNVQATAVAWASNAVPAVPEPETYAMLLAGLGLMSAITRRRSANRS